VVAIDGPAKIDRPARPATRAEDNRAKGVPAIRAARIDRKSQPGWSRPGPRFFLQPGAGSERKHKGRARLVFRSWTIKVDDRLTSFGGTGNRLTNLN